MLRTTNLYFTHHTKNLYYILLHNILYRELFPTKSQQMSVVQK